MARALSAYNHHVSQYIRSHPNMPKTQAMSAAAASWGAKGISKNPYRNPDLSLGSSANKDLLKWLLIGAAAIYLLPKLGQLGQAPAPPDQSTFQMPKTGL